MFTVAAAAASSTDTKSKEPLALENGD